MNMILNMTAILSGILTLGPLLTLVIEMFTKEYAGNYFFEMALKTNLNWALAGPNIGREFLGDAFLWGMAGLYICLAHCTIQAFDPIETTTSPVIEFTPFPRIYIPAERNKTPPTPRRKTQRKIAKRSNRNLAGWVYLLRSADDLYKIGRTVDPNNRIRTFNVKLPFDVEYEHLIQTDNRFALETELHHHFAAQRVGGEWFNLSPEDVEYIKSL